MDSYNCANTVDGENDRLVLGGTGAAPMDAAVWPGEGTIGGNDQESGADGDLDLERCFWEEMDADDGTDEHGSSDDDQDGEDNRDKLEDGVHVDVASDCRRASEAGTPSGWSEFISSAEGVARYMEEAAARLSDVSIFLTPSSPVYETSRGDVPKQGDEGEPRDSAPSSEVKSTAENDTGAVGASIHTPRAFDVLAGTVCTRVGVTALKDTSASSASVLAHDDPDANFSQIAIDGDDNITCTDGVVAPVIEQERGHTSAHDSSVTGHDTAPHEAEVLSGEHRCWTGPEGAAEPQSVSPSTATPKPENDNRKSQRQTSSATATFSRTAQTLLVENSKCPPSAVKQRHSMKPLPGESCDENGTNLAGATSDPPLASDLPWLLKAFESASANSIGHENEMAKRIREVCGSADEGVDTGVGGCVAHDHVVASVTEVQMSQRIERDKERALRARRNRWSHELQRAKQVKSVETVQAMWRGRSARAAVTPVLLMRRRELHERRCMEGEEERCVCVAVAEAKREKEEREREKAELEAMRCDEERTRRCWISIARREEITRQEELARMRAEERRGRALLDLELEDSRHADMIRRQAEECAEMHQEDLATRELIRREKARSAELRTMKIEDDLSRERTARERCELAKTLAERDIMGSEDTASSIWNTRYRREAEAALRRARALSTPVQRAMDPKGLAAARRLLLCCPENTSAGNSGEKTSVPSGEMAGCAELQELDCDRDLIAARYGRRLEYGKRLKGLLHQLLECRRSTSTGFRRSVELFKNNVSGTKRDEGVEAEGEKKTASSDGDNGETCSLTPDMLSHLGPLSTIAELELCVEGLTSTSLLRECTSLKSLSLNVNRLSSPADLVENTALVRLELRDNRLSSLRGLSGLPNLRELRLDINHLTSLHELQNLPALVELSANTNHIRELPAGFAACLLSTAAPSRDHLKDIPDPGSTTATSQLAYSTGEWTEQGGLQRLELYHNRIVSVHPHALDAFDSLTHLDLGRNQLETLDGRSLECCPSLSTLVLSQNLLREPPAPLRLPLLTELWLSGNRISSMGNWATPPTLSQSPSPLGTPLSAPQCTISGESLASKVSSSRNGMIRGNVNRTTPGANAGKGTGSGEINDGACLQDNGEGMWLPSLEILHLQDNVLETLGGIWCLAGCPLLRSLDASFNRLRTPRDFSSCLRACGELQEVRLHDNPAAEYESYADTVALLCPKLTKLDGNMVDLQAHWRAGRNNYIGRADLVLPFLLETPASAAHVRYWDPGSSPFVTIPKTTNSIEPILIDNATTPTPPATSGARKPQCPWCAVNANAGHGRVGDETRDDPGTNPNAEEQTPASGVTQSKCTAWEAYDSVVSPITCASCGCTFPSTGHWPGRSVIPPHAPFPAKWEEVISSGWRWKCDRRYCTAYSSDVEHRNDYGHMLAADLKFRRVCLAHREDRAAMRRRHRREKRNLESTIGTKRKSVTPAPSRTATALPVRESMVDAQSNTALRSVERLDMDFKLRDRHARERAQLVAQQLSLHHNVEERTDQNVVESARYEVVRSCIDSLAGKTIDVGGRMGQEDEGVSQSGGDPVSLPRRTDAARKIQYAWCQWRVGRKVHRTDSEHRVEAADVNGRFEEEAVTKLQSAFRGFHVRQALQAALDGAQYVDEELEGLLGANDGTRFDLDRFLSPPPELAQEWWEDVTQCPPQPAADDNTARCAIPPQQAPPDKKLRSSAIRPAVARSISLTTNNDTHNGRDGHQNLDDVGDGAGRGGGIVNNPGAFARTIADESGDECTGNDEGPNVNNSEGRSTRGDGIHDGKGLQARAKTTRINCELAINDSRREEATVAAQALDGQRNGVRSGGDAPGARGGARNELISAWGLKDPKVARAMIRRVQRMRKFETGEVRRERLKNPVVRLKAFARHASCHRSDNTDIDSSRSERGSGSDTHRSSAKSEGGWSEGGVRSASPTLAPIKSAWAGDINYCTGPDPQVTSSTHLPSLHEDNGTRASSKFNTLRQERRGATGCPTKTVPAGQQQLDATISRPWPPQLSKLLDHSSRTDAGPTKKTPPLTPDYAYSRSSRSQQRAPLSAHDIGGDPGTDSFLRNENEGKSGSGATYGGSSRTVFGRSVPDVPGSKQRVGRSTLGASCV